MKLVGVDAGTTRCKAGLFALDGSAIKIATRPTRTRHTDQDDCYYDPQELWETIAATIREIVSAEGGRDVVVVGVASMAEAGLLVDGRTGDPRSHVIPWFDTRSRPQSDQISRLADPAERFRVTGLHPSYKYGLTKLLWLREHDTDSLEDAVWLSVADYIAFRLTNVMATDPSLAARTYAYRILDRAWDEAWVRHLGIANGTFPEVVDAGTPIGTITAEAASLSGLPEGTPVSIAGHDHLCAAAATGATRPGRTVDSIGTAESLLGVLDQLELGGREYLSGLSYGPHVLRNRYFWLGGLSAAGGSVEWLRSQISESPISYEQVTALLEEKPPGPTGILYYPYLSGSGAPNPDSNARAALIGLQGSHDKGDLLKAVLEGTAYQAESIRRAAQCLGDGAAEEIVAVGGGAHIRSWLQIKADVSGCRYEVPALPEATLLGAAMIAGIGCAAYAGEEEAVASIRSRESYTVAPDPERHHAYRDVYERGYLPLEAPLRNHYKSLSSGGIA